MNYSNYVASIVTIVLLLTNSTIFAQQCASPPMGSDNCQSAPLFSCNLDGYAGSTSTFSAGVPPSGFCGIIENNQFLSFRADESPVILKITPSSCSNAKGIQASLYETTDCVAITSVSTCGSLGYASTITVIAPVVTIGKLYYLMIDGYEGDICDFSIDVVSGIVSDMKAEAIDKKMCLGTEIQLDGQGSSSGTNVSYEWEASNGGNILNGENTLTPTINQIGDYTLTVWDSTTCCFDKRTIKVTEDNILPNVALVAQGAINCSDVPVNLSNTASNVGDFSYYWASPNGDFITSTNDSFTQINTHGTYELTVTNNLTGCSSFEVINVPIDTIAPDVMAIITDKITCTQTEVNLNAQSMTSGTTFEWTGANGFQSNEANPAVNVSGIYNLTATSSNGCTQSVQAEVLEDKTIPEINTLTPDVITCARPQVEISGTSSDMVSYTWTGPEGFSSNNNNPIVSNAGIYNLEVTGINGCMQIVTLQVNEDVSKPDISINTPQLLTCQQGLVVLNTYSNTENINYQWSNDATIANPTVNQSGMYALTVTAANGCTNVQTVEVETDMVLPIADAGTAQMLTCSINEVVLDASNSSQGNTFIYEWKNPEGQILTTAQTLYVDEIGVFTLSVLDQENGCSAETTVEVTENITLPIANAGLYQTLSCEIGELNIGSNNSSFGSNYTYQWFNSNNSIIGNTMITSIDYADIYELLITDTNNGCSATSTVTVAEDLDSPNVAINQTLPLTCERQEVQLSASAMSLSGDFEVLWQNENNQTVGNQLETTIANPGVYKLIITDAQNGCSTSDSIIVNEDIAIPEAQIQAPQLITCDNPTTILTANSTNEDIGLQYQWQNANGIAIGNELEMTVSATGEYTLHVTNTENGCTAIQTTEVAANTVVPSADNSIGATLTCEKTEANLSIGNSSQGNNIAYQWKNQQGEVFSTGSIATFQEAGAFQLIVTDTDNGCMDQASVYIQEDIEKPIANAVAINNLTCTNEQVTLDGGGSTSGGNIAFRWNDSAGIIIGIEEYAAVTTADVYSLLVKNIDNGCEAMDQVEVIENKTAPPVEIPQPNLLTCSNTQEILLGNPNINTENYSYEWSQGQSNNLGNDQFLEVQTAGTYQLLVTDIENGCTETKSILVEEDITLPTANAGENGLLTCAITTIPLDGTNSSTGTQFGYIWMDSQGATVSNALVFETGNPDTYTLQITNTSNDCVSEDIVLIDQNIEQPQAIITSDATVLTCAKTAITLEGTTSNSSAPLSFQWLDNGIVLSEQSNITVFEAGVYDLGITNTENGCSHTEAIQLSQNIDIPEVTIAPPDMITCSVESIKLFANPEATGNYSFSWKTENGQIVSGDNTASPTVKSSGNYDLILTDLENACFSNSTVKVEDDLLAPMAQAAATGTLDCVTESVFISGEGTSEGTNFTYAWLGEGVIAGVHSLEPEVTQAGMYALMVTNEDNGCTNQANVEVEKNEARPTTALIQANNPLCFGQNNGNIIVDEVIGGTPPYLYAFDNQFFSLQNDLFNLENGIHQLTIQDAIGCEWDTTLVLNAPLEVEVDLGEDLVVELGEAIILQATISGDIENITWTASDNTENSASNFLEIAPFETSTYEILVVDENGCLDSDQIVVRVQKERNVFIPNAFTPNADGVNDLFQIFSDTSVESIKQLNVFDRWGEQIFFQTDIDPTDRQHGWNGEYRNKKMRPGIYVYFAEIEFIDGKTEIFKGDVTLID